MINIPKTTNFTISNHSLSETVRFCWEAVPNLIFSPSCGHLQPNCAKDVVVTYHSAKPHKFEKVNVPCKVSKIMFSQDNQNVSSVVNIGFSFLNYIIPVRHFLIEAKVRRSPKKGVAGDLW